MFFFKGVLFGEQHDGQEKGFGELLGKLAVEQSTKFGVATKAQPFHDNLRRCADRFGSLRDQVNHTVQVAIDQPVKIFEGVGVPKEPVNLGEVFGQDDGQTSAAGNASHLVYFRFYV